MKRIYAVLTVFAIAIAAVAAVVISSTGDEADAGNNGAKATFYDAAGNQVGIAKLSQEENGVSVKVEVFGLPQGFHGFHVHSVSDCVAPFTSAGGHFNPAAEVHPHHAADMPVLLVNADGTGQARFLTDRYDIDDMFDADGSTLIIHAGPDNYANIPTRYASAPDTATLATGDSGARIACAKVGG